MLDSIDPELSAIISEEEQRQENSLEMIASESIQSARAREIAACAFNNKTAVGYIGQQRLLGSRVVEKMEKLAARRACEVFGAEHANLTPYSGSMANYSIYVAVLQPGDRVLALEPDCGAHQTHGGLKNISSKIYKFDYFGLKRKDFSINYEEAERKARVEHPRLLVIGSAAYPRLLDYERLAKIAHDNGALLMTDIAHFSGLIAAKTIPSPVPYADIVTASTTKTLCGPHSGFVMCKKEFSEQIDKGIYPGFLASLHLQTIAAMAYAIQQTQTPEFGALMHRILENTAYFCRALQQRGFGMMTGGTDCHMFLADLRPLKSDAAEFAANLEKIGITVNTKNIPFDAPGEVNGIRAGCTVLSQRGFEFSDLDKLADIWLAAVQNFNALVLRKQVLEMAGKHKFYTAVH